MSLASGSTGNCYFLGTEREGFLIDAGIPLRTIRHTLKAQGIDLNNAVRGVVVTHDHADHIRMVGALANECNIPIYATRQVHEAMNHSRFVDRIVGVNNRRFIDVGKTFGLMDFFLTPFLVPHDSSLNVGYYITTAEDEFSFTLVTDVGHITEEITHYARKSQHLVLEANYDKEMLLSGPYPQFLKERVSGPLGHLSNQESVEFLCSVYHRKMKNVWLCHLSKDNNHPELCRKTFDIRLFNEGIRVGKDLFLDVLRRNTPSEMYLLQE
ncbi:MAG: MBL fold metallo-hydrolase [Porphyromonas sp.]|nr:MBL fold metallo-hydrolase [Porphyromonas sp.]